MPGPSCSGVRPGADVRGHLAWGGRRQRRSFRLVSLEGPHGPAAAGQSFASTGTIPGSPHRWSDRSTVTVAQPPAAVGDGATNAVGVFEFATDALAPRRRGAPMRARYRHRYEIVPDGDGCAVTYVFTQERSDRPYLCLALPIMRDITWRLGIPLLMRRGFRNVLSDAERRAAPASTTTVTHS